MSLIQLPILNKHLYLSDAWSCVNLKTNARKNLCFKETGLRAQSWLTILGSIVNICGETYMTI